MISKIRSWLCDCLLLQTCEKNELFFALARDQLLERSLRDRFPLFCPSFDADNPTSQLLQSRVLFPQRFLRALFLRRRLDDREGLVSLCALRDAHKTTRLLRRLDGIQAQNRLEVVDLRNAIFLQSTHWIERVFVYPSTLHLSVALSNKSVGYGMAHRNTIDLSDPSSFPPKFIFDDALLPLYSRSTCIVSASHTCSSFSLSFTTKTRPSWPPVRIFESSPVMQHLHVILSLQSNAVIAPEWPEIDDTPSFPASTLDSKGTLRSTM